MLSCPELAMPLPHFTFSCPQTHRAAHAKEARDREHRARRSQLEDLAAAETQRAQLAAVRLELERLRLLLERVSKRERLKREGELGALIPGVELLPALSVTREHRVPGCMRPMSFDHSK